MTDTVSIPRKEYIDLIAAEMKLSALENGGVDNWSWYSESCQEWYEEYVRENEKELTEYFINTGRRETLNFLSFKDLAEFEASKVGEQFLPL